MVTPLIHTATLEEVELIYSILLRCGQYLKDKQGLDHWNPPCLLSEVQEYVQKSETFIVEEQALGSAIATFTVSTHAFIDYKENIWKNPLQPALYLAKLAVLPEYQGQNIGTWCMEQVEHIAKEKGCCAVRFDALLANSKLVQFYQDKLDYTIRDIFCYHDPLEPETVLKMVAFEKILTK